jgi:hypothetical protein
MSKENMPEKLKHYKFVWERVLEFHNDNENGAIYTTMSIDKEWISSVNNEQCNMYMCKATIVPDVSNPDRYFEGTANETDDQGFVNRKFALENCETSALGRALSWAGYIGQEASVTTDDLLDKAKAFNLPRATNKQISHLNGLQTRCQEAGLLSLTRSKAIDLNKQDMDLKSYADHVFLLDQMLVDDKLAMNKKENEKKKGVK